MANLLVLPVHRGTSTNSLLLLAVSSSVNDSFETSLPLDRLFKWNSVLLPLVQPYRSSYFITWLDFCTLDARLPILDRWKATFREFSPSHRLSPLLVGRESLVSSVEFYYVEEGSEKKSRWHRLRRKTDRLFEASYFKSCLFSHDFTVPVASNEQLSLNRA